ncbi:hypothetical protein BpHYR1_001619 [Brachionus plicatilis]|uniref:Uncharacterized protein n=1 Tax=Brachionus plicatilis TaxID=10195 RepID=A0A3M7P1L5_BRAPC|nr:hypothetical protein BpHYR1_001619 [Brachionus plicatilis]
MMRIIRKSTNEPTDLIKAIVNDKDIFEKIIIGKKIKIESLDGSLTNNYCNVFIVKNLVTINTPFTRVDSVASAPIPTQPIPINQSNQQTPSINIVLFIIAIIKNRYYSRIDL